MLRTLGVPEGDTVGPTCRGLVFLQGDIAYPMAQRGYRRIGTDGLAPVVSVGLFFGCSTAASYEFPPASKGDPKRETAGLDSHHVPVVWRSHKGTLQARRAKDWCSQRRHCRPNCPTRLPMGWHRPGLTIVWTKAERILAFFPTIREEDPRPETAGSDSHRAHDAWCSREAISQP